MFDFSAVFCMCLSAIRLIYSRIKESRRRTELPTAIFALTESYIAFRRVYSSRQYAFYTIIRNSRLHQISLGQLHPEYTVQKPNHKEIPLVQAGKFLFLQSNSLSSSPKQFHHFINSLNIICSKIFVQVKIKPINMIRVPYVGHFLYSFILSFFALSFYSKSVDSVANMTNL
jgi:hypothetical protein